MRLVVCKNLFYLLFLNRFDCFFYSGLIEQRLLRLRITRMLLLGITRMLGPRKPWAGKTKLKNSVRFFVAFAQGMIITRRK